MDANQQWKPQTQALGAFIRAQRTLADLSLREMATMTHVSNAYLSQIERGLHQPSVRVLSAIAQALNVPADELLAEAGLAPERAPDRAQEHAQGPAADGAIDGAAAVPVPPGHRCSTEQAILSDPRLSAEQRAALLGVYRSFAPEEG
jgi:transcriptional regulator with XRE-family HTH domain